MADLMKDSTSFETLKTKYGNFAVPSVKITSNGFDLVGLLQVKISQVSVDLSFGEACSANFTVEDAYTLTTRMFSPAVTSVLALGSIVTVELGYGSSRTRVFKGFISEITTDYGDAPSIQVTALDVVRLLMQNWKNYKYEEKTYAAIVKSVMRKYLSLCSNFSNVETSADDLEGVTQNSSDFEFLKELAGKADKEFFIFAGAVYFRTPQKQSKEILTLEWGKNLLSFQLRESYCYEKIIVQGIDKNKTVRIEESDTVKSPSALPLMTAPLEVVSQYADIKDSAQAKKRVASLKHEKEVGLKSGSGSCIGLPELVPGRFIYITGIEGKQNEKVYLKSVKHTFDESGFGTSFTLGG